MKKIKFSTMALVALIIISCAKKSDVNGVSDGNNAEISIIITGDGDKRDSRAVGPGVEEAQENAIHNFAVFLFDEDGRLNIQNYFASTDLVGGIATIKNATTTARSVYIVANTGATEAEKGLFADIKNLTDLKAVKGDLMASPNTSSQVPSAVKGLWMHGFDDKIDWDVTKGKAAVVLGFSSARIEIVVKDARSNVDYTFSDNTINLMFAGKGANFFADNQATQTEFYSGKTTTIPSIVSTALLHSNVTFGDNTNTAVSHHFYTFGNNSGYDIDKRPTILNLSSLRTPNSGGVATTLSYPVHFSEDDKGTDDAVFSTIEAGKKYTVTITLTSEAIGTPDPEFPVTDAGVEVTVTTKAWVAVTMDKEF